MQVKNNKLVEATGTGKVKGRMRGVFSKWMKKMGGDEFEALKGDVGEFKEALGDYLNESTNPLVVIPKVVIS